MRSKKDQKLYDKTKRYLEKIGDPKLDERMKVIDLVLEKTDKEERYSYLYDLICDYLDNEFKEKNICGFCHDLCKRRRNMMERGIKKNTYINGCCHSYLENADCPYLKASGGCKIKNIACKTYTCFYLKKQGIRYSLNKIYLSRYFFNTRQKFYMKNTYFVDKPVIMQGIMKRG